LEADSSLTELQSAVRQCWVRACLHDGLDPAEQFVADFSVSNSHKRAYDGAVTALQQAKLDAITKGPARREERKAG